jgi:hypothetical protein
MNDILALVDQARRRTLVLNKDLSARFALNPGEPPVGGFNMVNQHAIIALETLSYYHGVWSKVSAGSVADPWRARQENAERVNIITKAMFILSMSAFEFTAKETIKSRPRNLPLKQGRVYLRNIIGASIRAGLIDPADEQPWEGVIELRNILVHNNGIADKTATYQLLGGPSIALMAGGMAQGNLKFFPKLLLWTIEAFARWSEGHLR